MTTACKERLLKYLCDNSSYQNYVKNFICIHKSGTVSNEKEFFEFLDNVDKRSAFDGAFPFYLSPEGDRYWRSLHNEWLRILKGRR